MRNTVNGTIQNMPATPVAMFTRTSARCVCGDTITLRTDNFWWHGARVGTYCRELRPFNR